MSTENTVPVDAHGFGWVPVDVVIVNVTLAVATVVLSEAARLAVGGEHPPQPRHVAVEHLARPLRRALAPHPVGEAVDGNHAVGVHEQRGQHAPLPGGADVHGAAVGPHLDVAQEP
jgi:hypothetical protein